MLVCYLFVYCNILTNKTDMKETVKLPLEEFKKLYAIKIRLETYFSYMEDNRGALKNIAPTFLEDAKEYIKEIADQVTADNKPTLLKIAKTSMQTKLVRKNSDQLADIVFMAMIDGEIHQKEYDLCLHIAERLDMSKNDLDEAIKLTKKLWGED